MVALLIADVQMHIIIVIQTLIYWTNGNGRDGGTVYELTVEQEFAYELGYLGTKIRKNGDDLEASLYSLLSTY